jgi:hypothetical protein
MLLLTSTSDIVRLTTSAATTTIEVHTSFIDVSGTTITPGRTNTRITTATTTTIVASPAASTQRNVKAIYCTNNSTGTSCTVGVEHFDGTNSIELISFILLPGENLGYREDGSWVHRDAQGAEYPPSGLGAYTGRSISFTKSGTAPDTAGYWYGTWKDAGFPGAWVPGTPGLNGRVTDGTQAADYGCIPVQNASTGANFLTEIQMAASVNHAHFFYDVLWVNSGIVVTTVSSVQTIASPTLPARDINGTTDGEGCVIGLYFSVASTLAAVNALSQVTYTNSKGVAGKIATQVAISGSQAPATPVVGTVLWYNLAAGDSGVRSIQGFNIGATSWLTGTINLFIARDIATIGTTIPNVSAQKIVGAPGIRLYNGSCIQHAILASAATATFFAGELVVMEK